MGLAKKIDSFDDGPQNLNSIYSPDALKNPTAFTPVSVQLITPNSEVPFDLYSLVNGHFILFKDKSSILSPASFQTLLNQKMETLYLRKAELPNFLLHLESNMASYLASTLSQKDKAKLIKSCSLKLVEDLFKNPNIEEFNRATKVAKNLTKYIITDREAFRFLMDLQGHDEYTYLHSVGVACLAVELAYSLGIKNPDELVDVAMSGMLHDIGKAKIPWTLINKEGPLNPSEWDEMQKHAMYGFSLIRSNPTIELRTKMAILQHHESPGGKGYPAGLEGSQLDIMTKIITTCDIFNALTSTRSYSAKRNYLDALTLMKNNLAEKIDPKIFNNLVKIHGENYKR